MFLLCYIHTRYQQISDFLIITLQYHVKKIREKADEYADIKEKEYNTNCNQYMPKVAKFLRWFVNDSINKSTTYDILSTKAFKILPASQFKPMADSLEKIGFDREKARWHHISHASRKIALYLRSIFMALDFSHQKSTSERLKAIQFLQYSLNAGKTASQIDLTSIIETIVSKKKRQYMYTEHDTHIQVDFAKLEFFVYEKITRNIEEGIIFCSNSLSYKSLDDDFISNINEEKKLKLIEELGYTRVLTFSNTRLEELCTDLNNAWIRTNNNIKEGTNSSIKFNTPKNRSKWSLSRSNNEDTDNTSVFDQLGQTEIADIAFYIFKKFNLIKIFSHIKPYRSKQDFTSDNIIACTLAGAFGCSLNKMFEISDLNLHELRQTYTNAIRIETLKNTNDFIVNEIAKLEIFPMWDIIPNKRLSDADGQKFESKFETIQSRHSTKFFGLGKGVVPYTLVTNHVPINSRIISPNEHESHFTFDIIYNNTSDIQPDMVTGDMHSINQLNFFILDAINVEFVPSYRDIYDKSKKIYCVGNPKQYEGLIKPIGQINIDIIKEQSKTIEKMLLSLIMQETKQSIIVKKLSSHKRYGRLKKALWEYNKILSSIHILNLIDNKELRKHIKTARNRTESFHQLQSKIRKVHGGKFSGKTILENEIWNQAARLVANMTIAYNSIILNDLAKKYPNLKNSIRKISPIAWRHINFTGKYTFKKKKKLFSFDEIVEKLKKWL